MVSIGNEVRLVPLLTDCLTIGRSVENDIALESDAAVSRRHAVLEWQVDRWQIRDLGSRNGTFVNGLSAGGPTPVRIGDTVTLGGATLRLADLPGPSEVTGQTLDQKGRQRLGEHGLTARECEVVRLVGAGLTDAAIAGRLSISVKTVHSHLERIKARTALRRRADLTRLAVTLGLTDLGSAGPGSPAVPGIVENPK